MNIDDSRVEVEGFWLKVGDKSYPVNRIKGIKVEKLRKLYPSDNGGSIDDGSIIVMVSLVPAALITVLVGKFIPYGWILYLLFFVIFISIGVIGFFIHEKSTQPTSEELAIMSEKDKEYEERNKKRKMLRNVKVEFDGLKPVTVCKSVSLEEAERIKGELESAIGKAMMKSTHSASD